MPKSVLPDDHAAASGGMVAPSPGQPDVTGVTSMTSGFAARSPGHEPLSEGRSSSLPASAGRLSVAQRAADVLSFGAASASALCLVTMAAVVCYEIVSRTAFNAPTAWVTEIATYLLVAVAFLGLAAAQRADAHIRVDLLLSFVSEHWRERLVGLADWIGLLFIVLCSWQAVCFNVGEYLNGTRDWGLLSTPQWIPELSMSIGFALFALALLADAMRRHAPVHRRAPLAVPLVLLVLLVVLFALGRRPVWIPGLPLDWGSAAVATAVVMIALSWSGWRTAAALAALVVGLAILFASVRGATLPMVGLVLTLTLSALLITGVRIAMALGLTGLYGAIFLVPRPQLSILAERAWTSTNSFTLTAVPMFVFMSVLLLRSGVTTRMFDSLVCWFGRAPGGLAHASIAASALFAAVSGSSLATAASLGRVACPEMMQRGYGPRLTFGVVAAGATLGIMIPPSIAMIIYGSTVGAPVNMLFVAGIVPGLLLALIFMVVTVVWSRLASGSVPVGRSYTWANKARSLLDMLPFAIVITIVLGSLFLGIATPTESAAIGVAMALLLCIAYRRFTWRMLYETAVESAGVTAFILLIVVCAAILSWVFDFLRIPQTLIDVVRQAGVEPWLVLVGVTLLYLVLGMFIESISMILMTLPVTFPLITALGFDPIWFGIYLVIMVECGLITPPVGIVLFVLRGLHRDIRLADISMGALPFVFVLLAFVCLIYVAPGIVTWLPGIVYPPT